jgi:hypothetical protein
MLFVHAERNGTKINLPIHNVPELYDPQKCAAKGRKPKSVRESAEATKEILIAFGWENVKIILIKDAD